MLVAVAAAGAKAGLMLFEVRRSAAVIGEVLLDNPHVAAEPEVDPTSLADAEAAYASYKSAQAQAQQAAAASFLPTAAPEGRPIPDSLVPQPLPDGPRWEPAVARS